MKSTLSFLAILLAIACLVPFAGREDSHADVATAKPFPYFDMGTTFTPTPVATPLVKFTPMGPLSSPNGHCTRVMVHLDTDGDGVADSSAIYDWQPGNAGYYGIMPWNALKNMEHNHSTQNPDPNDPGYDFWHEEYWFNDGNDIQTGHYN